MRHVIYDLCITVYSPLLSQRWPVNLLGKIFAEYLMSIPAISIKEYNLGKYSEHIIITEILNAVCNFHFWDLSIAWTGKMKILPTLTSKHLSIKLSVELKHMIITVHFSLCHVPAPAVILFLQCYKSRL
jgi:hypothetical protein